MLLWMASWALWQALPPRYQLTCKDINAENDYNVNQANSHSPRVPRSPRVVTPRQGSARSPIKRPNSTTSQRLPNSHGKSSDKALSAVGGNLLGKNAGATTPRERRANGASLGDKCFEAANLRVKSAQAVISRGANVHSATQRGRTAEASNTRGKSAEAGTSRGKKAKAGTPNGKLTEATALRGKNAEVTTPRGKITEATIPQDINDEVAPSPRSKATMYFTVSSPRGRPTECDYRAMTQSAFPPRRSSFINNFKQQQLINSMRDNFEDPSTASPRSQTRSPKNPNFPVTQISSENIHAHRNRKSSGKPRAKTATTSRDNSHSNTARRHEMKCAGTEIQSNLYVNTISPFETPVKPFIKNPLFEDKPSKRYVVRKLDDATMFIDDDKIIFIKKKTTKNDILQCQKNADDTNYLAHLRKLYLRDPKDVAKFMQNPDVTKKTLIRERLEYDKRTDNILNYYSRIDDRENAFAWTMSIENANRHGELQTQRGSMSARAHSSPGRRREHSSKPQTPVTDRPATSGSYRTVNGSELYTNHDALSDWNVFVKFNSQSILHERQFYLQTPMISSESMIPGQSKEMAQDCCECRLCELEMEMARQHQQSQVVDESAQKTGYINKFDDNTNKDNNITVVVDSCVGENNSSIQTENRNDISKEKEMFHSTSDLANINNSEDDTANGTDSMKEKNTINLTIDLSTKITDSPEIKSKDVIDKQSQTSPRDRFSEMETKNPNFSVVMETKEVMCSDDRGKENIVNQSSE